ncbi:MAG TPA: HAMP domain-containing sensor histidine kinase [Candidatus Binatia bacterium]|nr:HAMP domain-containing sensor histidine kinase [Candidatus Binatia bacterium]
MSRRNIITEIPTTLPPVAQPAGERPAVAERDRGRIELPGFGRGLSARVLALTVVFVMLSEVLIYAPSIARFRLDWLEEKLASGHLATLALEATPDYMIDPQLELTLLQHAGARLVALHTPDGKNLMLRGATAAQVVIDATIDLDDQRPWTSIGGAFGTLGHATNRVLRVMGHSPRAPDTVVEVVLDEGPLRQAMIAYSWRVLGLSIVISLITATLIFLALQWFIIRPMQRMTAEMVRFRGDPEAPLDSGLSRRSDEIGIAEREFGLMRQEVRRAFQQKERLAALGTAVNKINHDLRGILSTARLVADRLTGSGDPEVRKAAPALEKALDRAVDLCSDILNFTREGPPRPELTEFPLGELCAEVKESLARHLPEGKALETDFEPGFAIVADRGQLFRVVRNLGENALQMGAQRVTVRGRRGNGKVEIEVEDDGPGLPPKAVDNLFRPFRGSARVGGTGLGLAIARELARVQGGDLRLAASGKDGAKFAIELPDRVSA